MHSKGVYQGKLKPISHKSFESAQVICPSAVVCEILTCDPCSLLQVTKPWDIPRVTLIKGTTMHENVQLLAGQSPECRTFCYAHHKRIQGKKEKTDRRKNINSAKFLKVGRRLWVDCVFFQMEY
jgi:hypothetical protein